MKSNFAPRTDLRWAALFVLTSSLGLAAPRTVTIAAGDCRNPELITATQTFSIAVAGRMGGEVLTSEAVLERFRPVPTVSSPELSRQLEAAQTQFYAGAYDKALEALRQSSAAIERLSPRAEPWKLMSRGLLLQALVHKSAGRKNEAVEAQKRVLRIDPGFKLDADYYTPGTIQAFEALRKEMLKVKKVKLTITSSPTAAQVFLDGAPVGKTPFAGEYPLGDYRLALVSGEKVSFTRDLKLSRDEALQIDVGFEGALSPQPPLCLAAEAEQGVDLALKLAALAGADQVVVLGLEARNNEPGWVNAVLLEVNKGSKVREGGIRFIGARRAQSLTALAGFVLTGNPSAAEVAALATAAPAPVASAAPPPAVEVAIAAAGSEPAAMVEQRAARGVGPRVVSVALMGAGAIVGIAAAGVFASGGVDRSALATLIDQEGRVRPGANPEEAIGVATRVDRNTTASIGLAAAGGAALVAGAALF
ncbi:MAG: hypothetical protein H6Q89_2372, partial [Myxococcaceae bacterium]|nr:hypothetical protein [Myxococcaceae bacterium]